MSLRPVFTAGITQPWHSGLLMFLHPPLPSLLLQGAGRGRRAGGVSVRSPLACAMQKDRQDDKFSLSLLRFSKVLNF